MSHTQRDEPPPTTSPATASPAPAERDRLLAAVRDYWQSDAETYDQAPGHGVHSAAERAALTAVLADHLPAPPATVLDVGAGTGMLSLAAADLGHDVTALDLSPAMLTKLEAAAAHSGLTVTTVTAAADEPPTGGFDAVMERHLLWTLPDPHAALGAWAGAAPGGRLLVFESLWGLDPLVGARQRARTALARLRREPPHHHREYDPEVRAAMPFGRGTHPDQVVAAIEAPGWSRTGLHRLWDMEWAGALSRPVAERLLGPVPRYLVRADAPG
jgi:SAM-dependent methyltransferase